MAVYYFTQNSPGAPAYATTAGAIISILDYCLVTGMGWTKTHSGTNLATYRASTGNRFYIAFDDTSTTSVRIRMYETVTSAGVSITAGTNPTPTNDQMSGGLYLPKPAGTGWFLASDGLLFYFGITTSASGFPTMAFGDFISYAPNDSYNTVLRASNTTSSNSDPFPDYGNLLATASTTYVMRSFTQIGSNMQGNWISNYGRQSSFGSGSPVFGQGPAYPNPITNTLDLAPIEITHSNVIRGRMPGVWNPLHSMPFANGDTLSGSGAFADRQFVARSVGGTTGDLGQILIETSDTWRT